jgi:hypothetical protein
MAETLALADTSLSLLSNAYNVALWLWTTTKKIQNAPEAWNNTKSKFITDTKNKVDALIVIVNKLVLSDLFSFQQEQEHEHIKNALQDLATQLEADSLEIETRLGDEEPEEVIERVYFALRGQKSLHDLLSQIETRAGHLLTWLHLLDLSNNLRASLARKLEVKELDGTVLEFQGKGTKVPNAPLLYKREAEYRPIPTVKKVKIPVLADEVNNDAITIVAGFLTHRIGSAGGGFATGILPCLGYKDKSLIFRLPCNVDATQTLQTMISGDITDRRVASLGRRFDLARQLAEAVFMLHSSNIMHKNLRADTFLLLEPKVKKDAQISTDPFVPPELSKMDGKSEPQSADDGPDKTRARKDENDPAHKRQRGPSPHHSKVTSRKKKDSGNGEVNTKQMDDRGRTRVKASPPPTSEQGPRESWVRRSLSRLRGEKEKKNVQELSDHPGGGNKESKQAAEENKSPAPPGTLKQWLPQDSILAVLTHWSDAKQHGAVSGNTGPAEDHWQVKVHRHWSQQSANENTAYHFGHDIYALGVCLLEIGLWDPLVRPPNMQTASDHLLSAGGAVAVHFLTDTLKKALERGGSRTQEAVISALEEPYDKASHRLREAMFETVIEEALKDEGDGARTLVAARGLRNTMNTVIKGPLKDIRVVNEVRTDAQWLVNLVKEEMERGQGNSPVGPVIARSLKTSEKRRGYVAGEDELKSLLKRDGGGKALSGALVSLAERQLPSTMGVHYTRLVVKCLKVLEGGFGEETDFGKLSQTNACTNLETQIVAPLRRVNLGN